MQKGKKDDSLKLRFDLIIPEFETALAEVLTYGAKKYKPNNWKQVPQAKDRFYAALRRHLNKYRRGELHCIESSLPHLAQAACNIMFLYYFEFCKKEKENQNVNIKTIQGNDSISNTNNRKSRSTS